MKKQTAKILVHFNSDLEIRDDYSGRGMYGRTTYAVEASSVNEILSTVANMLVGDPFYDYEEEDYYVEDFIEDIERLQSDSMGMGMIFY